MDNKKIAVFFDCDNISASRVDEIFSELANKGEVILKQAYKDWTNTQGKKWDWDLLKKYAITPVQITPNTGQKNTSDIQIVIDVMETIYMLRVDVIALVSSDSDFTALANKVKTKAIEVYGFGEEKTNDSFRNACSEFMELSKNPAKNIREILPVIKQALSECKQDSDYAFVSQFGNYMKNKNSSYIAKNFGEKTWGDFFKKYPDIFDVALEGERNSKMLVKIKPGK